MLATNTISRILRRRELLKFVNLSPILEPAEVNVSLRTTSTYLFSKTKQLDYHLLPTQRFYSIKPVQNEIASGNTESESENNVTVIGEDIPSPYTDIDESEFPDYIKNFLKKQGFSKPTVIQSHGWPIAMKGQNFVGIAQTGTGKTLAYLLPAVVHIKETSAKVGRGPRVLVLAPTRELARQIEQVAKDFERLLNIRCACIYGGANRNKQSALLKAGVDIVIATPGRLNDFITSKVTSLHRCSYVVLDEADRMLDMGFEPQIRQALEGVPLERQIMMFSATWPKEVRHLAKDYLGEFVQVNVGSTQLSANHNIKQHVHISTQEEKMDIFKSVLGEIIDEGFEKMLVFANTKRFVDVLTTALMRNGLPVVGIHGDKSQMQRDIIINKFKTGQAKILIATDVAARGLDVDGVTHVINYDFPNIAEDYIHRIGRTGRQGNKGVSHTIFTDDDGRQAINLVEVLKEANQVVPAQLEKLAMSYSKNKFLEQQEKFKYKPRSKFGGPPNQRWNKFRNPNRNSGYNYNSRHRNLRDDRDDFY